MVTYTLKKYGETKLTKYPSEACRYTHCPDH